MPSASFKSFVPFMLFLFSLLETVSRVGIMILPNHSIPNR